MLTIHNVVHWEKGPKDNRTRMVQASYTDETGHHTNHFSEVEWDRKVAAANAEDKTIPGYTRLDISPKDTEDKLEYME